MPKFEHRRTHRVIEVRDQDAHRFRNARWSELVEYSDEVPTGSVAEILEWAGDDPDRRAAALAAEKAGKKRKGIIGALS